MSSNINEKIKVQLMRRIFIYFFKRYFSHPHTAYIMLFVYNIYVHVRFCMVYFYYNVDDDKFISHIKNSVQ
jgi:hypothetical protein